MKILFVVTAFYPEQAIGAIRITKFAKYLLKKDVDVSIISLSPPPWAMHDETLKFDELANTEWDVIDQSSIFKILLQKARVAAVGPVSANSLENSQNSAHSIKNLIKKNAHFVYTTAKAIDWSARVSRHVRKKYNNTVFDIIFCSFPSLASPLTGVRLKKMGMGKRLAVDFRDPMSQSISGFFSLGNYIQKYLLKNIDFTFHISEGVKNNVLKGKENVNARVLTNGFDLDDADSISLESNDTQSNKNIKLVYTGSLYGGKRDLSVLFEAISSLAKREKINKSIISIEYAGPDGEILKRQAKKFHLDDLIFDHGILSRSEAVALQGQSDICLLATWNSLEEQGVLTGKVFEYFMFKKPILSIVGGDLVGSEIGKVIEDIGAGHCCELANPESLLNLEKWLQKIINQKISEGSVLSSYNSKVEDYNIANITESLHKAFINALDGKN